MTWSRCKGGKSEDPLKTVFPVLESKDIIFDLVSEILRRWLWKNVLVLAIRLSSPARDRPIRTKSSAKNKEDTLMDCRSIPNPEEFNSFPKEFMKIEKRRGLRLQPERILLFLIISG